jgi:uncharacterized protein (TIGR02246 family)
VGARAQRRVHAHYALGGKMKQNADEIATRFIGKWESAWNQNGAAAAAKLYTPDSVLVGKAIATGRGEIERQLELLHQQGWTGIAIKPVNAREVGGLVLVACEFTAFGSGSSAGKTLDGKSSHVLVCVGDVWLSAMHTAA